MTLWKDYGMSIARRKFAIIDEAAFNVGLSLEALGLWVHVQMAPDDLIDLAAFEAKFPGYDISVILAELVEADLVSVGDGSKESAQLTETEEETRVNVRATVYVMEAGGMFKIGVTTNVRKRRKQIQTGNPHQVKVVWTREFDNAVIVEITLHKLLRKHRMVGEWFNCSSAEIDEAVRMVLESH